MTAIGLGIAYGTSRLASSWLYDVRPSNPWILGSALGVVVGVTVVATLIPVGRAARSIRHFRSFGMTHQDPSNYGRATR